MSELVLGAKGAEFSAHDVLTRRLPEFAGRRHVSEGLLYILEFSHGVVKVGRTETPRKRVNHHINTVRSFTGAALQRGWLSAVHSNHVVTEKELIRRGVEIADRVEGNEYFFGASFKRLVAIARTLEYGALVHGPEVMGGGLYKAVCPFGPIPSLPEDLPPSSLPPRERDEDPVEMYEALKNLAELKNLSIGDIADMSWLDIQEMVMDSRVRRYGSEMLLEFNRLQTRVYNEGRNDLLEPMLTPAELRALESGTA